MEIVLRAAFAYALIVFVTRISGRRELSTVRPVDLVLLIVIAELVQNGISQSDYSLTGTVLAVATLVLLAAATSYLTFRFRSLSHVLEGAPVLVVRDGEPIEAAMRSNRLTLETVLEAARRAGVDSLSEIAWAVLEPSGSISVIRKPPSGSSA